MIHNLNPIEINHDTAARPARHIFHFVRLQSDLKPLKIRPRKTNAGCKNCLTCTALNDVNNGIII